MGYASYLEDILDRSTRDLDAATSALKAPKPTSAHRDDALRAVGDAKTLLLRIRRTWDLATDPELDLAHEVTQQHEVIRRLEGDIEMAKHDREQVEREMSQARQDTARAQTEIRKLEMKVEELEAQFESLPFDVKLHLYPPKSPA